MPPVPDLSVAVGEKLKPLARKWFGAFGIDIVRLHRGGSAPIVGSFPPHAEYSIIGRPENYYIHDNYQHRNEAVYYRDTGNTDQWQLEIYKFAREVLDQKGLRHVCDIGCGSAYKLMKYFADCHTVGLDVAKTCKWLRKKYPNRIWEELDFNTVPVIQADMVIAADVIEHLVNPDELMSYITALRPQYVVFSTPDRNLLLAGTHNGPPCNPAHMREWSFAEFEAYVDDRFEVLEHFISNSRQCTQCVLCAPPRAE